MEVITTFSPARPISLHRRVQLRLKCANTPIAVQIGKPEVAQLLSKSLAEEENADAILTQVARPLMAQSTTSVSGKPQTAPVIPKRR